MRKRYTDCRVIKLVKMKLWQDHSFCSATRQK